MSQSVAHTALDLDVAAIVAPTESGHTAQMISKYRPKAPIIAVTSHEHVIRRLALTWGVYPQFGSRGTTTDDMLQIAIDESLKTGIVSLGELVVITAGVPIGEVGTTNLMKIHLLGGSILKAQGIGRKSAKGKVVIAKTAAEALEKVTEGSILVTLGSDSEMMPAIEKCAALITEEGGLTSHAAVVGVNLGIPVIVGAEDATKILEDGQIITVDARHGMIYDGHSSVL